MKWCIITGTKEYARILCVLNKEKVANKWIKRLRQFYGDVFCINFQDIGELILQGWLIRPPRYVVTSAAGDHLAYFNNHYDAEHFSISTPNAAFILPVSLEDY